MLRAICRFYLGELLGSKDHSLFIKNWYMKNVFYLILAGFFLNACTPSHVVVQSEAPPVPPQEPVQVSYQSFYDEMSPYGRWVDYPGYGYVWMPSVGYGFRPYATNGHWVYTDMGWAWSSNYPWGWAAFHYGRWFYDGSFGWMWMPGQEWAPAWVSWRKSPEYYGWAPLGPNISMSMGYGSYNPPANYWCFVPNRYVASPQINNYYVNESRNVTIINNTTVINNYNGNGGGRNVYRGGPDVQEVSRVSGSSIRPVVVRESNRPGEQVYNNQYNIYRPRVNSSPVINPVTNRPQQPMPTRVESVRDLRPVTANNTATNSNRPAAVNNVQTTNANNAGQPLPNANNNPDRTTRTVDQSANERAQAASRLEAGKFRNENAAKQNQPATRPVTQQPLPQQAVSSPQSDRRAMTPPQHSEIQRQDMNTHPSQSSASSRASQAPGRASVQNNGKPSHNKEFKENQHVKPEERGRPEEKDKKDK